MNNDLLKIIEHFGLNNQQRKLQEEIFELQEAITRMEMCPSGIYCFLRDKYKEHIIEEMADCLVLLGQIQQYYNISDAEIHKGMVAKTQRTLERIRNKYYENE